LIVAKKRRSKPRRRSKSSLEQIFTVRVPASFEAELDGFVTALQAQVPWVRLTRADALRWLLEEGLKQIDQQLASGESLGFFPDR
jgi:hypothetical protein